MPSLGGLSRFLLAALLLIVLVPALAVTAQDELSPRPDESSPATRHAQVIAQGVAPLPGAEIGWRVRLNRAVAARRAVVEAAPAGFVLAADGAIALIDERGALLARVAPGEAVWSAPDTPRAVVTMQQKPVDYYEIALVPAEELGDKNDLAMTDRAPFTAPEGERFDIDLIRDVLERAEESVVATGPAPALLLVTSGSVFVQGDSGAVVEMTAGLSGQVIGEMVVTGASRAPAAFVVARIGPGLPDRVVLREATARSSPVARASPVGASPVSAATPDTGSALAAAGPAAETDTDNDGLTDAREDALGTSHVRADSDGDGLDDGDEIDFFGTDALLPDTDDDGLADGEEVATYGTNPFLADTDGDGAGDEEESATGSDPLDGASLPPTPTPLPTVPPEPAASPAVPAEMDGQPVTDREAAPEGEMAAAAGTPPSSGDRDGDGLSTGDEAGVYGTDPTRADSDGDGFSDGGEIAKGTDPLDPDDH